jgi:hypothetical protein
VVSGPAGAAVVSGRTLSTYAYVLVQKARVRKCTRSCDVGAIFSQTAVEGMASHVADWGSVVYKGFDHGSDLLTQPTLITLGITETSWGLDE